ncbi:hypothetical protein HY449_04770 [Candidatus Pacearchaeota archaeon]|nr:hypothetical protein [Candidatus Pacearchaeota archaeon]
MKNKYLSNIARAAFIGAPLALGLVFFPARNAAMQNQYDSKSVMEQMIERHFNPKPGNLWEDVLEKKEAPKKQREMLKIAHSKNRHSPNHVLRYFNKNLGLRYGYGLSRRDMAQNYEIIRELRDEEFAFLVGRIGFDNVRKLVMKKEECGKYPLGDERAEKLRGLVGIINDSARGRKVNAMQLLEHVSVESGGENFLNCEGGGGVFHLLYNYNRDINPLNANKNIARGIEMIEYLTNQFGNPQTAAVAFNTSNGKLIRAKKDFERYMKRTPNHLELMACLKRTDSKAHKKAERYEALLRGHGKFLGKYFSYDKEKNRIMIIPQIKYFVKI